ncbi:putative F-box protein At3g24580 [Papaver somniferum]|uniref:putative F-box protein At3g24580 n=1 Tax=Papaver somniferum TaxID=3469 RepID=UPI000E7025C9|nr:putative F-box protein At3g24580 [Papaver somniferum]
MLKPINGLLCFVNNSLGSVLICNPTTGEKTSWIQTTSGKLAYDEKVVCCECDFGFGFHRPTKEHKVVCVYSIIREVEQDVMSEETICEVLTVGSNTWRRMDEGPFYMVVTGVRSVYVSGFIYWIGYSKPMIDHLFIVGFDVGREKFSKVILLPNLIGKSGPKLVEVDGHISVLDRESDKVTLWIHNDDGNDDGNKWIQEIIKMPYTLDEDSYLAFEAINGTNMIILKPFRRHHVELEYLYYYD